ncbi:MAG TPA: hypothetical protein VM425_06915 [Myxococcota bacterium]|nr:hypothetical protein [Myxococcota bacterium]
MLRSKRVKAVCLLSAILMLGFIGTGCGGSTTDACKDVANACVTDGSTRCNATNNGVESCTKNADACLVWTASMTCGELQTCLSTGATADCRCNSECATSGSTQCSTTQTTIIQTCAADTDGCLFWQDGIDCATTSKFCDDTVDPAVCSETCTDKCTAGTTQCNGTIIQGCAKVGDCYDWVDGTDCDINGQICSDTSGTAGCYAGCTDDCTTLDATQCSGDTVQTCEVGADGCNDWTNTTVCAAPTPNCVENAGAASCSATCQNRCTDGETQCDGDTVQTCAVQASTCTDWNNTTTCNAPREACVDTAEPAVCVEQCTDACDPAVDASQCSGTIIQACQLSGTTGCYAWVDQQDCNTSSLFCDDTVDPAVCVDHCTNECDTVDAVQCNALMSAIEKCTVGADGCNDWVVDTDCSASNRVCYAGSGEPKCVVPCTNECDTVDATQCNGVDIETCQLNANDGCNDLVVTSTCTGATPACDDSTGSAACVCADECTAANDTQCSGNTVQTCAADGDADSCLEWKDTTDCTQSGASTDVCADVAGTAACVCADECTAANDTQCSGNTLQTCAADGDADSCLEWKDTTDCTQGGASTDVCGDVAGTAACVCSDECQAAGNTKCDAGYVWIQTCVADADADSCLEWNSTTDCSQGGTSTDVCELAAGSASCVSTCTNDCTTVGARQCGTDGSNPTVEECQLGVDTCNHWIVIDTCTGATPACDAMADPIVCVCADECTAPDDNACSGNVPQNCVMQGDGCTDLVIGTDCGADTCIIDGSGAALCQAACTELVNQPIGAAGNGLVSQELATQTTYNAFMADDFTLTAATDISMMKFTGFLQNGLVYADASALHFGIYADNGGLPGGVPTIDSPVWGLSVAPTDAQLTIVGIDVVVNLTTPATLPAGTYWISFWVTTGTDDFHYWGMADTVNGAEAMLVNPGEGFGIGTDWVTMTSISVTEHDTAFGLWSGPACCVDLCPSDGATTCNGNDIWLCAGQTNGCLGWQADSTCSDPTPFCDDSSGTAACVSSMQCNGTDLGNATGTPVITGDNTGAGDDFLGTCGFSSGGLDVCYTWTAPATGVYVFDTEGSAGLTDTVLYMYEGITEIACSEDDGTGYLSVFVTSVTLGQQYVIVVDGYSAADVGVFNLNIEPVANEDVCDDFADNDFDELPDCADPTDCQAGAACVPGAGAVGVACTAHTDCSATATDPACLQDADGWGNGYCSEWCWPDTDDCPAGSLCMNFGYPQNGLCLDACDPAAPDCRSDTWVDPATSNNCSYVCTDLGDGQGVCQPRCLPNVVALTVDGGWTVGDNPTGADSSGFSFTGTAGTTYYVWWDDGYDGSGAYAGDEEVSAYHEDFTTAYFSEVDSGYTTSQQVTIVTGESTVYIVAHPYGSSDYYAGPFAIAVSSTNALP